MAGLYIHIPFCKTRCVYCAFHSGTDLSLRTRYVAALCHEMELRSTEMHEPIRTVYLGGGTPSLLHKEDFERIFATINAHFELCPDAEITLECNPDDLNADCVEMLTDLPFNRVSVGIQSFDDEELHFLRRRHTTQQAREAVERLKNSGFDNISIDLMFGLPCQTEQSWSETLRAALSLDVQHISAYSLTFEPDTTLARFLQENLVNELDEETSLKMFRMLIERLNEAGFEHYEISNFCKKGYRSRHNSAYWKGENYLGIGAAAHSYNGSERRWNVADTRRYIEGVEAGSVPFEEEQLTANELCNELVFTGLRTSEGVDLQRLAEKFGAETKTAVMRSAERYLAAGTLTVENERLRLTRDGIFVSDGIMADLMTI